MSPEEGLRRGLFALWTLDSAVSALIGNRVYDRVPKDPEFPYVEFGETQLIDEDAACHERFQGYQTMHVWSRSVGNLEAFSIASALRKAVREADWSGIPIIGVANLTLGGSDLFLVDAAIVLSITENYSIEIIRHESTRVFDDPDGLTTHGVVSFHTVLDSQ